jgi:hypothetical protein
MRFREGYLRGASAYQPAQPSCRLRDRVLGGPTAPSVPILSDLIQLVSQPLSKPAQTIDLKLPDCLFDVRFNVRCVLCHWHAAPIVNELPCNVSGLA